MYMKDSDGKKSFTVTISLITFFVVMLKVLVGGTAFNVGGVSIAFGNIGSDEIAALLGPTLFSYITRRYTDAKFVKTPTEPVDSGEKSRAGAA